MPLEKFDGLELSAPSDFHVHLRDGEMMRLVTPTIRQGGNNIVFVMPNLVPPITTVQRALDYQKQLQSIEPAVKYLMSLYLHPDVTPEVIREAKKAGIAGVKSYPAGVTTNSSSGVVDYEQFYPVFKAMEEEDMILNLHGESPSGPDITVLNAEEAFLPTLLDLHKRFPNLRIILEHCTTAAAIEAVKECGDNVAATITAHHLYLTVDDWAGDAFCFCKPVAKLPKDKRAILKIAVSGNPKFFFGSDSAPHPVEAKHGGASGKGKIAAGVFTQPYTTPYVVDALERACEKRLLSEDQVTKEKLEGFLGGFGRAFYKVSDDRQERMVLKKQKTIVAESIRAESGNLEVVNFRKGEELGWTVASSSYKLPTKSR
ncbi:Dihydroorotase [Rhizodiscina lignyota]|uniref:dihydroorotase n=1 Tax=Rhizodiscina lignyota TaxID=1504668 RepID=A0A9P4M6H5_9PEZI|nr:Dihydroorotase [Rhizodiscina lignyota]